MNISIHGEKELLIRLREDLETQVFTIDHQWEEKFWEELYENNNYTRWRN
ncbi:MAG TPA: hypothetical protein VL943_15370 [Niabella sp.]|nr:hypothetical protein [Niabella sp.]